MFQTAFKLLQTAHWTPNGDLERSTFIEQALPDHYSLQQLHKSLVDPPAREHKEIFYRLIVLWNALRRVERLEQREDDAVWVQRLLLWLSEAITPRAELVIQDEVANDGRSAAKGDVIQLFKRVSIVGLNSMRLLRLIPRYRDEDVNMRMLLSLLTFTDPMDAWSQTECEIIATELLQPHEKVLSSQEFIVEFLLATFIRPLFSKSKPAVVTTQGRKALNSTPAQTSHQLFIDPSRKPWKFDEVRAVTIFSWAVIHATESMVSQSWHLFIPPTLTIIDDPSADFRVRGLMILKRLLTKTTPQMLDQTGVGDIFEDTVMPILAFLPNLTPAEESLTLLKPAYSVLFDMAVARFPNKTDFPKKVKFLDRIMRQGILNGILHCRDNAMVFTLLLEEARTLVGMMGIDASKHIKSLVPILSSVIADAFAVSQPALLLAGIRATQMIILNCWPRMTENVHRKDLIKALGVCWVNLAGGEALNAESRDSQLDLNEELRITGLMLVESVREATDIFNELEPLLRADPSLRDLFDSKPQGGLKIK